MKDLNTAHLSQILRAISRDFYLVRYCLLKSFKLLHDWTYLKRQFTGQDGIEIQICLRFIKHSVIHCRQDSKPKSIYIRHM